MARSTQYIGLTKEAQEFVDGLVKLDHIENHTIGMFEEKVPLGAWVDPKTGLGYLEEVQARPWSGGPMIFTYLVDVQNDTHMFKWVEDEKARGHEFIYSEGLYWV